MEASISRYLCKKGVKGTNGTVSFSFLPHAAAAAAAKSLQLCLTVQPHGRQPTSLPRPWDSPGKNTGVGCHFLLQCMKVKNESEVAQSHPTLSDPMDCSLPGSSICGIFQARVRSGVPWPSPFLPHTYSQMEVGFTKISLSVSRAGWNMHLEGNWGDYLTQAQNLTHGQIIVGTHEIADKKRTFRKVIRNTT